MSRDPSDLLTPRILVVDDESQIHASLRLRLAKSYELVCCHDAREALRTLAASRFDLCFVDIHMPEIDGIAFIESAQRSDPALGYVMLSAFDTSENLRRTIPLRVFDFVGKPLPERHEFEARIPGWVERTRQRRRDHTLAEGAAVVQRDLDSALLERDVEMVASETARDALLQTASLLTTIHAHLISAVSTASTRAKSDPGSAHLLRNLEEARKTSDAAMLVAEGFFDSAYGSRDSSPAHFDLGMRHAIDIALRMNRVEAANKTVDFNPLGGSLIVPGLTGIDFLLMMVPAIAAALTMTDANSTVGIRGEPLARLESTLKDPVFRDFLWLNRKNALLARPAVLVRFSSAAPALSRPVADAWIEGRAGPLSNITPRGLLSGLRKCGGLLGIALAPARQFRLLVALPT